MISSAKIHIQSVTEITRAIKRNLESEYKFIHVQGEVSNLRTPFSGHLYFSLKDSSSQIKAVLFKGKRKYLAADLRDGDQIICHGRVSVYEPRGEYQLIVDTVDSCGSGALQLQFEQLKMNLSKEGLFSPDQKKNLPSYPDNIVIICSPTSAALFDFLKVARLRDALSNISIFPVRVQGRGAELEIAQALDRINLEVDTDLIAICRGGGSIEDLWAFNEEVVARAIHRSSIPVITGIGHEIDSTIADFCADQRTPTPTAAAEAIFQDREELVNRVERIIKQMATVVKTNLQDKMYRLHLCKRVLSDLDTVFTHHSLRLDIQVSQLVQAMHDQLASHSTQLSNLKTRLRGQLPQEKLQYQEQLFQNVVERLKRQIRSILDSKSALLGKQIAHLESVGPLSTLARGYSIVTRLGRRGTQRQVVRRAKDVKEGERLGIQLHEGKIECEVTGQEE